MKLTIPMADAVQDLRNQTFTVEIPDHVVKFGDTDSIVIVRRDGSEAHLPPSLVAELVMAVQDTVDMLQDEPPDHVDRQMADRLAELVEWLPGDDAPDQPLADLYVTAPTAPKENQS